MSRISKKFVKLGTSSDEINARDLEGNFTPSNYSPAQVASEGNTKISAHLNGIDTALSDSIPAKRAVVVATTGNITLSGEQTIDGVLTSSMRVLVKDQTASSENGIYLSNSGAWTRTSDMSSGAEITGAYVAVQQGNTHEGKIFVQNKIVVTVGSDDIGFIDAYIYLGAFNEQAANSVGASLTHNLFLKQNRLSFHSADTSNPGMVDTTTQSFAGAKTFTSSVQSPVGKFGTANFADNGALNLPNNTRFSFRNAANNGNFSLYLDGANEFQLESTIIVDGSVGILGSTSGTFKLNAADTTTSYSVKMPAAQGAAGKVLTNDGSGNLSWDSPSAVLPYTTITADSQTLSPNNGYIIENDVVQTDLTLPTTAAKGTRIEIIGNGDAGWVISQGSGQSIINVDAQTLTGVDGKLTSSDPRACIVLICITANTTWAVLSLNGRLDNGKTFGYIAGGSNNGPASAYSDIFKLDFAAETGADITDTLGTAREEIYGTSSSTKGYFASGLSSGPTFESTIDALTFADDSVATLSDTLDAARSGSSGVQSADNGYYLGGYTSGPTFITDIAKLNFTTEAVADIGATLTEGVAEGAPVSSSIKGYRMGGIHATESSVIDALTFSGESVAALSATLDATSYHGAGVESTSKGYCCGGLDAGNALSAIQDLDFSNETSVTISATLPADRAFGTGTSSSTVGYIAGGYPDSTFSTDTIYALDFAAETTSTLTETLDQVTRSAAGASV